MTSIFLEHEKRYTGYIKMYNPTKKYGFVIPAWGPEHIPAGPDVFLHDSKVAPEHMKKTHLVKGGWVEFTAWMGKGGRWRAHCVTLLPGPPNFQQQQQQQHMMQMYQQTMYIHMLQQRLMMCHQQQQLNSKLTSMPYNPMQNAMQQFPFGNMGPSLTGGQPGGLPGNLPPGLNLANISNLAGSNIGMSMMNNMAQHGNLPSLSQLANSLPNLPNGLSNLANLASLANMPNLPGGLPNMPNIPNLPQIPQGNPNGQFKLPYQNGPQKPVPGPQKPLPPSVLKSMMPSMPAPPAQKSMQLITTHPKLVKTSKPEAEQKERQPVAEDKPQVVNAYTGSPVIMPIDVARSKAGPATRPPAPIAPPSQEEVDVDIERLRQVANEVFGRSQIQQLPRRARPRWRRAQRWEARLQPVEEGDVESVSSPDSRSNDTNSDSERSDDSETNSDIVVQAYEELTALEMDSSGDGPSYLSLNGAPSPSLPADRDRQREPLPGGRNDSRPDDADRARRRQDRDHADLCRSIKRPISPLQPAKAVLVETAPHLDVEIPRGRGSPLAQVLTGPGGFDLERVIHSPMAADS